MNSQQTPTTTPAPTVTPTGASTAQSPVPAPCLQISSSQAQPIAIPTSSAKSVTADALLSGSATLIGAFLGAMVAFLFQKYLNNRKTKEDNLAATHYILFCLFQQTNKLLTIELDFIKPYAKSQLPFIAIPAAPTYDLELDTFRIESFSFMLKTKSSRMIAYNLYLAQNGYITALKMLNERSRLHQEEVQVRLANAGIVNGSQVSNEQVEKALGTFVWQSIQASSKNMIETVQRSIKQLYSTYSEFREFAVTSFNSTDFTEFKLPED